MGREEPPRLLGRLEALHLPFPAPGWAMGVLGTVVQVAAAPVPHVGQDLTLCYAVAAQAVGDQAPWPVPKILQQVLEEALGRTGIAPALHQNVEHDAVLVHRTPKVVQLAIGPAPLLRTPLIG